jgi:hypothetical protein
MNSIRLAIFAVAVALSACSDGITAPSCDRCDEMRVLTDRAEYRPGTTIAFTITNQTSTVLRYDWCSVGMASKAVDGKFTLSYSPARRCGFGAGLTEVLENMVVIPPGETLRDSIIGSSTQSLYRLHIWLLEESGAPEVGNPVVSNTFEMFPGANSALVAR